MLLSSRYCFRSGWFSLASLKKPWASVSEILIISCASAHPGKLLLCNFSQCFSLYESQASPVSTSENSISLASPSPCCLFHYLLSFRFCRLHQLANSFCDPPTFTLLSLYLFTSICICIAFFSFRSQFFSISGCLPFFPAVNFIKGSTEIFGWTA